MTRQSTIGADRVQLLSRQRRAEADRRACEAYMWSRFWEELDRAMLRFAVVVSIPMYGVAGYYIGLHHAGAMP